MKKARFWIITLLLAGLCLGALQTAQAAPAVPPNPSSFYGQIHFITGDGGPVANDYIEAWVPGMAGYAARAQITTDLGNLVYAINVPGDDAYTALKDGGGAGDTVTFKIGGRIVATYAWVEGSNVRLHLHPPSVNPAVNTPSGSYVGVVNEPVQFLSDSQDWLSGVPIVYAWDLDNDGAYDDSTAQNPAYIFTTSGTKTVGLKVTDNQGGEDTESTTVVVVALGGLTGQTYDSTAKSVSVSGLESPFTAEVTYDGSATAPENAGSYAVVVTIKNGGTVVGTIDKTMTIAKKEITVTAAADTKGYDGTTSSAAVPTITSGGPLMSGDTAIWSQTFDTEHVGSGKTLTPSGTVDDGNGGNNYAITFAPSTSGVITQREITVTAVTSSKEYDGTTTSTGLPTITEGSLATGDTVAWSQVFEDKNAGTGKALIPSGTVNDGNGGLNYAVTFVNIGSGVITARSIRVTAVSDIKEYDGTTSSDGVPVITSVNGLASGDLADWSQSFDTKHAGKDKYLTPTGTITDGNDGNNYVVFFESSNSGEITQRPITVTAAADTKEYDGTTTSDKTPAITSGGPLATVDSATWTQTFDNRNAGSGKTLTPTGTVSDGNGGANYLVTFQAVSSGVITQRPITVKADDKSKTLGAADPALTYAITSGSLVAPDTISGDLTREAGETVGTYAILQGTLTAGGNYALTFVPGTFTIQALQHTIDLEEGWNLVSIDLAPVSSDVEDVLASIDGSYDLVYAWDASGAQSGSGNWLKFDNQPLSEDTLETIHEKMGFWIHMTAADTLEVVGTPSGPTTIDLLTAAGGWNLVGYPTSNVVGMPSALEDHDVENAHYTLVYAYHAADLEDPWKLYDNSAPAYANDLASIAPTWGYWIFITADETWSVGN